MNRTEFWTVLALLVGLLALAAYFGWRQIGILKASSLRTGLPFDERLFLRRQAYRRLLCSGLMLLLAGWLIGWYFLEGHYEEVMGHRDPARVQNAELTDEEKSLVRTMTAYCAVAVGVLSILLVLAAMDMWAIARFGLGQHRKLQADQRTAILSDVARRRSEANGHH